MGREGRPGPRARPRAPRRLGALLTAAVLLAGCAPLKSSLPTAALTAGVGTAQAVAPPAPPGASTAAATPSTTAFADVPADHWAAAAISGLAQLGLLTGVAPGRFAPEAPVTRAEFATMLTRAMGAPAGAVGPTFADVAADAWYAPLVEAAAGLGWMRGVADTTFQPAAPVSRAQAAAAAVAALGLNHVAADEAGRTDLCPFTDCAAVPNWAVGAADVLAHLGIMRGGLDGRFQPTAPLTRAEAAVLLWQLRRATPAALAAEGQRVAAYVRVVAGSSVAEAGTQVTVNAYAHDATGYIVPAGFRWSVAGPGHFVSADGGTAVIAVDAPGNLRVTATVAGRSGVGASAAVQGMRMAALAVQGLPPAGLAHAAFPVQVSVRTASGGVDTAIGGPTLTLSAQAVAGGPSTATSATVEWGKAAVPVPDLPAGTYTLTFHLPGAADVAVPYQVVGQPVGSIALTAGAATIAAGDAEDVQAALPAGTWPVQIAVSGTEAGPPPLTGEAAAPTVLRMASGPPELSGPGIAAHVVGNAPGAGTVTVSVPGGALSPATIDLTVRATGAFGDPQSSTGVVAGTAGTVAVAVTGNPGAVCLEPVDPAGHPLPPVAATVAQGVATAGWTPLAAGVWRLRWRATGALPVQAGTLQVLPGPAARLMVDPSPTSILLPGQQATLRAWVADRYGNPVAEGFRLTASTSGAHGTLHLTGAGAPGPGAIGTFTATTVGSTTVRFSSPDHPSLAAVALTLRTVAGPAGRIAGKGLWLTFPDWKSEPDDQIVADALATGATHLYLEVATSSDGFYGARALDTLLPRAHAAGLSVLAWVYPSLADPAADTAVLRAVAAYRTPGGDAPDGLALDIEEQLDPPTMSAYARAADAAVGPQGLVVGVTWAPAQRPNYPYAALAGLVGAFAPMDYWHVNEADYSYANVYNWIADSVRTIRRLSGQPAVPVEVIAGTFDWFAGGGGHGIFSPSADEVAAAIRAASDAGAIGVSFYRESTATAAERSVIMGTAWPPAD